MDSLFAAARARTLALAAAGAAWMAATAFWLLSRNPELARSEVRAVRANADALRKDRLQQMYLDYNSARQTFEDYEARLVRAYGETRAHPNVTEAEASRYFALLDKKMAALEAYLETESNVEKAVSA
ncbi:MAG: hypothetical protein FJ318_09080 [SAR202 cluster bacterium]|nr:hypothetical protein [SAR202 cluster bacterium]